MHPAPHRGPAAFARPLLLAAALAAAPAAAQPLTQPQHALLHDAPTPAAARAMEIAHARRVETSKPAEAADAYMLAGHSAWRSGLADSAADLYRRAVPLGATNAEAMALIDVLLLRARAADLIEAYGLTAQMLARTPAEAHDYGDVMLRSMWIQHLAGHADSAAAAFARVGPRHPLPGIWRVRAARVLLEDAKDIAGAGMLLHPLEIRTRGQDPEIHALFTEAAAHFGRSEEEIVQVVEAEIAARDQIEERFLASIGAQRMTFPASDGFLVSGIVRPRANPGAPVAVVISRGDTLARYDSLLVHLGEAGYTTLVLEPRGHGLSIGPPCAAPFRWSGREDALEERVARDAVEAVHALAGIATVDTTRRIVAGAGFTAGPALRAAELSPAFGAVILASAEPARVDRGVLLARVKRLERPLFIQTAPEDLVDLYYYSDALYQAGDRRRSRVSSGVAGGRFAEQFRNDPKSGARLRAWVEGLK